MMKKHKIRKSKHLLENKKDVDENVENILRMIGQENNELAENEPDDSRNDFKKSKLSSLVKGFHEDYQYLHKHYKQLISKLENVGHSSTGSDSSDLDSEGDNSDNGVLKPKLDVSNKENGWKQKLDVDHQSEEQSAQAEIEKLEKNIEEQAKEISNLKQLLNKATRDEAATRVELSSKVASLSSENEDLKLLVETAESKAGELHKTLTFMENEIKTFSSEKQVIERERDDLKISIIDLENKREDLNSQLQDTMEKCTFLSSQLEKALLAEKEVWTLSAENEKMKNENLMMSVEYDSLKTHQQNVDIEHSQLKATLKETKAENESLARENHFLENKLRLLGMEIDGLRVDKEDLLSNINKEREAATEEKERLLSEHSKCLNGLEKAESIVKELESTKDILNDNFTELQKEKNSTVLELRKLEASLKKLENELEQHLEQISAMQKTNENLELVKSHLHNELTAVQGQKDEVLASSVNLERKLEQQTQQLSNLQEAIENLKASKTRMYNEVIVYQEEKNAALMQLKQSKAYNIDLQSELEQQQNQISVLQQANKELEEQNSSLNRQIEEARTNLQDEIIVLQGEKEQTLNNLQKSNDSIKKLEGELEQQREQILSLQLVNEDMLKSNSNLKKQLEDDKNSLNAEILAVQEEKNKTLSEMQQSDASIRNLGIELDQARAQISILHLANEDMKNNNTYLEKQLHEAKTSLHAEIVALCEEKETALSELQQYQASVRNFETEVQKQNEHVSTLVQANDDLQKSYCVLIEQFEEVKTALQKENKITREEKDTTLTQLKQSEISINNLEREVVHLKEEFSIQLENNSSLDKQLEEAILKVSHLYEKLEKVQAEAASQINDMNTNAKDLEKTIGLLSSQKTKVDEDLKSMTNGCKENIAFMKHFEDRVKQKISEHETELACLQQSLKGVFSSCQRLQHAYHEMSAKASELEILKKNQIQQIDQLKGGNAEILNKHRHLEDEKLYVNNENLKLQNHVEELEVQIKLVKQKLKVIEAESKCKEKSYMTVVETSQAEIQHLELQMQQYLGRICSLEESVTQIKENAESQASELTGHLDEQQQYFDQSFEHLIVRSSACNDELKFLRSQLQDRLDEQKELLKGNNELAIRLRDKEKVLSEMARSAAELEEKMIYLEKKIEEKEEELAARVQEKREAIKQSSNAIVYHKNNSDDLVRYIRSHNRPRLPFCL